MFAISLRTSIRHRLFKVSDETTNRFVNWSIANNVSAQVLLTTTTTTQVEYYSGLGSPVCFIAMLSSAEIHQTAVALLLNLLDACS